MLLLFVGLVMLGMKYMEMAPVAAWSWYIVLSPFPLAIAWWAWADTTGYTKRREMDKMEKRRQDRIEKQRDAMGMLPKKRK
jgi:small Trp-rich protein